MVRVRGRAYVRAVHTARLTGWPSWPGTPAGTAVRTVTGPTKRAGLSVRGGPRCAAVLT